MADETLKIDANYWKVSGAVTDDSNLDIVMLRVDPVTKRLKVAQSALSKSVDDILIYANTAKDGSGTSYVPLVDTDGHLQVDVVSGGTAGVQYTEGDTDATITGTVAMAEGASDTIYPLKVDASGNLNVNVAAGSASSEQYADGTAVNAAYKGNLILGTDGSNYQIVSVDSNGHLQVDVLSGGGAGEQYADGTAVDASYKGNLILGTDGTNYQILAVDSDGNLQVDVLTLPNITLASQANPFTSAIPVSDNGGSLTIDGSVSISGNVNIGDISAGTQTNDVKITLDSEAVVLGSPADATYIGDIKFGEALPAGTNNIGDVDVATQPARAATTDSITAKLATDALQNGLTAVTPKFAVIDAAASGDNQIVAAVTGKKIRVLQYTLVCAAATDIKWYSASSSGTALSGLMSIVANSGISTAFSPVGLFETVSGEALILNLSAANQTSGTIVYCEI